MVTNASYKAEFREAPWTVSLKESWFDTRRAMTPTAQRDEVSGLAKSAPARAWKLTREIPEPWFRAQALSWVARYAKDDPCRIAHEAEQTAELGADAYQRSAVRAWEIAALAERGEAEKARRSLAAATKVATSAQPASSRCQALALLLHAAARLGVDETFGISEALHRTFAENHHWRCKRAVVDAAAVLAHLSPDAARKFAECVADDKTKQNCLSAISSGGTPPRPFFW